MEKGDSERVLRREQLMAESQGALVGRVIAVDAVNEMLLDMVQRLGPGVAGDEAFRAGLAKATDRMLVGSLLGWDKEVLAVYSNVMLDFERRLFPEG